MERRRGVVLVLALLAAIASVIVLARSDRGAPGSRVPSVLPSTAVAHVVAAMRGPRARCAVGEHAAPRNDGDPPADPSLVVPAPFVIAAAMQSAELASFAAPEAVTFVARQGRPSARAPPAAV